MDACLSRFLALLQRVPPRQRAVLLLKDVVGWSAEDIVAALDLSVSSVNSALHRAREVVATDRPAIADPTPELLRAYVQSWEGRAFLGGERFSKFSDKRSPANTVVVVA